MSATNTQAAKLLDEVLAKLDGAIQGEASGGTTASSYQLLDAIDREIAAAPRQTAIASLRSSPAVAQLRQELETESLTITTVTAFLQVLQQVLPLLLAR